MPVPGPVGVLPATLAPARSGCAIAARGHVVSSGPTPRRGGEARADGITVDDQATNRRAGFGACMPEGWYGSPVACSERVATPRLRRWRRGWSVRADRPGSLAVAERYHDTRRYAVVQVVASGILVCLRLLSSYLLVF